MHSPSLDPLDRHARTPTRTPIARAGKVFLAVAEKPSMLCGQPRTREAFAQRTPYLNSLHAVQGEVMSRMRGAGAPPEESGVYRHLNDAMVITVQGIAAGMRNTG